MTSTTFFIIFIPILTILLLVINLILAPHNPYQEKDSAFECGFNSFLGQNRTQFSVSFFIFGLLFLLFDLEILLVYPYSVSSYTNDIYGLVIMMVFFVLLTLGFIFELGKNALTIDSRQTSYSNEDLSTPHAFLGAFISDKQLYKSSLFGIYPAAILDAMNYSISTLIYSFDFSVINCDAVIAWGFYFQDSASPQMETLVELHDNIMYYLAAILFMLFILTNQKVFLSQNLCSNYMVKPHIFATKTLQSDTGISEIITEITTLLPQLANFINQFNTTVSQSGISVVTDSIGTMSIDVPQNMTDDVANKISTRIGIIDRLITTRGQEINDLLQKGTDLENKIKMIDSNYVSQLTDKIQEFKRLNSSYKH